MDDGNAQGRINHTAQQSHVATASNGVVDSSEAPEKSKSKPVGDGLMPSTDPMRMNDLPDAIVHITQGFIPLSLFLTRLTQVTHNSLQEKIMELAKMPIPASAVNGAAANLTVTTLDDTSAENLRKKATLLHYAQDMHAKWVKALVITEWSRKSQMVSKLIDLKFHIDQQRILYDMALDRMVNVKRDLTYARLPSPDLKTALQILSTGSAPWIPDHQYIEPPPLTAAEKQRWINELDTLLSLRLNIHDYDKIPHQFRDYEIASGRVTFKVPGEFEVDLTIADEDFEKQFWFIDFRYTFTPSRSSPSENLRNHLENCVNDALAKDGLAGCYQFLHELVLTSKINELKRQALKLSRTSWDGTLIVEPLNRSLAIQYWSSRPSASKSWVLVAVNSGRKNDENDSKSSSRLVAKWYRDNKEVKDVKLDLDVDSISAESLLKEVVGRHIEYILRNIHVKLLEAPRFKHNEASMALCISRKEPGACMLTTQVSHEAKTALLVEPTTGLFAVKPQSKFSIQYEHQINTGRSSADDGVACLENIRCAMIEDELHRRCSTAGWQWQKSPLTLEETKSITKLRDWSRTIWLRRQGWDSSWYIVIFLSLGGDEWRLVEVHRGNTGRSVKCVAELPLNKDHPDKSESFWNNLTIFTTAMIAQAVDMRELHRLHIKSRLSESTDTALPQPIRLPSIQVALSAMLPSMVYDGGTKAHGRKPWANNIVVIRFKGIDDCDNVITCKSEAVLRVRKPSKFAALKSTVDKNLSYNPKLGEFCLRLQHGVGEPVLALLKSRIKAIDRFVDFLEAMEKAKGLIVGELVTLKEIRFQYQSSGGGGDGKKWRITLDLSEDDIGIQTDRGNPHLRVLDFMLQLVNGDGGIGALIKWLPASLGLLQAVNNIDTRWEEIRSRRAGSVEFKMRTLSWMSLRYTLVVASGPQLPPAQQQQQQKGKKKKEKKEKEPTEKTVEVALRVRIETRRGKAWWHVYPFDDSAAAAPTTTTTTTTTTTSENPCNAALKAVWNGKGKDWTGLTSSAAARADANGIADLLRVVDDAIRSVVTVEGGGGDSSSARGMQPTANRTLPQPQAAVAPNRKGGKDVVVLD